MSVNSITTRFFMI